MLSKSYLAVAIWLAGHLSTASAEICYNFGVGPVGTCYVDPRAVEKFEAYLNYDNSNTTCNSGAEIDMSFVYVDTQGNTKTVTALTTPTVTDAASTVNLVPFDVPLTSLAPGQAATLLVYAANDGVADVTTSVVWTPSQVSTISYVTGTTTTTAYTTVAAVPTTTHVTYNQYVTVTPGSIQRSTKTLTTKIATTTLSPVATTISAFITPATITSTHWISTTTTKTFSCDPNATGSAPHRAKRNFFDATASAPVCGTQPLPTTITTKMSTMVITVTSTTRVTVLSTTVKTTTKTASQGKTKYVGATTTTTSLWPKNTFHIWSKVPIPTTVVTKTRTTISWVDPGKATGSGACKPAQTYSLSATAQISAVPVPEPTETATTTSL